jgi:hypothetical protein
LAAVHASFKQWLNRRRTSWALGRDRRQRASASGSRDHRDGLPENVVLTPVPDYDYQYAYINNVPVLVDPSTRRVQYLYR